VRKAPDAPPWHCPPRRGKRRGLSNQAAAEAEVRAPSPGSPDVLTKAPLANHQGSRHLSQNLEASDPVQGRNRNGIAAWSTSGVGGGVQIPAALEQ
jgi:hypothetical protein